MKPKNKRILKLSLFCVLFFSGCIILFINLRENLIFFYSPSEILGKNLKVDQRVRVGGMVKESSLKKTIKQIDGRKIEEISFVITDYIKEIEIFYVGILPDLFKEGEGVVVEGVFENKYHFNASIILAKHDENYMPPEIKNIKSINERNNDI